MYQPSVEKRIQQFLENHRRGRLEVLTGYVSIWGLAWLQEYTAGRPTTLLVGDLRPHRFGKATPEQRRLAAQFLNRADAKLQCWYTKKAKNRTEDIMHAKAWITRSRKPAVLLGSANLTQQGLQNNFELMAEADKHEIKTITDAVQNILSKAYPATDRVTAYINNEPTHTR